MTYSEINSCSPTTSGNKISAASYMPCIFGRCGLAKRLKMLDSDGQKPGLDGFG